MTMSFNTYSTNPPEANAGVPNAHSVAFAPSGPFELATPALASPVAPAPAPSVAHAAPPPLTSNPMAPTSPSVSGFPMPSPVYPGAPAPATLLFGPPTNPSPYVYPTAFAPNPPMPVFPASQNGQENPNGTMYSQLQTFYNMFAPVADQHFALLTHNLMAQLGQMATAQTQPPMNGRDEDTHMQNSESISSDGNDEDEGISYQPVLWKRKKDAAKRKSSALALTVSLIVSLVSKNSKLTE
jgi:hypothetical protein